MTDEELDRELRREDVRDRRWRRRGLIVLLLVITVTTAVSSAVIAFAFGTNQLRFVLPAFAALSGAGAASVFIGRILWLRLRPKPPREVRLHPSRSYVKNTSENQPGSG
jgi:uncharacterized membrane protein